MAPRGTSATGKVVDGAGAPDSVRQSQASGPVAARREHFGGGKLAAAGRIGIDQAAGVVPQLNAFLQGHQDGDGPPADRHRVGRDGVGEVATVSRSLPWWIPAVVQGGRDILTVAPRKD